MRYIMWYLLAINYRDIFLYGIDKQEGRAKKRWRIPEATLLSMAALGALLEPVSGCKYSDIRLRSRNFILECL